MPTNNRTTLEVPIPLNDRIKKLAASKAAEMGLSKPLTRVAWLELVIKELEERKDSEKQKIQTDQSS